MSKHLPARSSLRQLKSQAKDLRKAYEARAPEALQRFRQHHPHHASSSDDRLVTANLTLQDAQLVIAREYGFDSWPKLADAVADGGPPTDPLAAIIGSSGAARQLRAETERAAASEVPVLLHGERGTGKRLVAATVHELSVRSGPFVHMACDASPDYELFGYEPGAFTGAHSVQDGKVAEAAGGTLLMDEVASLSMSAQATLMALLERGMYRRFGGSHDILSEARIVATTSCDLAPLVEGGSFRQDLFYSLQVLSIHTPGLGNRLQDIPELVNHFAAGMSAADEQSVPSFSAEALAQFAEHDWPGNIRELRHAVEGAVTASSATVIEACDVRLVTRVTEGKAA